MKVDLRKTGLSVVLKKNIARTTLDGAAYVSTRFVTGSNAVVDLTPYIGERNGVRVRKSVREPAGSFSITMTDQLYYPGTTLTAQGKESFGDSLYGLIEPMDSIEIRMTGNAYKTAQGTPYPMMMRGFVSRVEISEAMGADGKPQRNIIVSGQDYGKILQMIQIFHQPGVPYSDAAYITAFPFYAQFGVGGKIEPAQDFMNGIFDKVVDPYILAINPGSTLTKLQRDFQVSAGQVSPFGTGGWQGGTIQALIQSVGDIGPWNEFFIEDRDDAPYVVYRPNPFMGVNLKSLFAFKEGKFPGDNPVQIGREDIVSISAARTDANVANYFWVEAPRFNLNYDATLRSVAVMAAAAGLEDTLYLRGYPNVDPALYGQRKMWEQTNQGGDAEQNPGNATPAGTLRSESQASYQDWITQRRIDMITQNKDNIVFESGSIRMKGNEAVRAGTYLAHQPGNVVNYYYATSVEHDYAPFGSYFTSVEYERGTGFIGRTQQDSGAQSPYLAEMVDRS